MAKVAFDMAIGLVRVTAGADEWAKLLAAAQGVLPFPPQRIEVEIEDPPRMVDAIIGPQKTI